MTVEIRDARPDDLPAMLAIYNQLIEDTTVAWTETLRTLDEHERWFLNCEVNGYAVLVAHDGGEVIGTASYGEFRDSGKWPGYRFTVEHSIHVRADRRGVGIGRQLLEELMERAIGQGVHVMVGAIDGDNDDSLAFHEAMGFREVARMPEVGFKFGRWLDLVLVQRQLD